MGTRHEDPIIDYALFWLEHARPGILKDPNRSVHHWTHPNYSGGRTGWEDEMDLLYFAPKSLEQSLLRGEVHTVMLEALEWALQHAETKTLRTPWTAFGGLDISEAYRLAHMVAMVDPSHAASCKRRLNALCSRTGKSLSELADVNFDNFMGVPTGITW